MDPLYIYLIVIFVFFFIITAAIYFFRLIQSGETQEFFKWAILGILVILVYWFFGGFLFTVYNKYIYLEPLKIMNKGSIEWMDTIWYTIFFITIMVFIAFIVKTLKEYEPRINLVLATFGLLMLLGVYTVIYYIWLTKENIEVATLIAFIVWFVALILLILCRYFLGEGRFPFKIASVIFGISSLFVFVCIIFFIFKIYTNVFDYVNK